MSDTSVRTDYKDTIAFYDVLVNPLLPKKRLREAA